MSNQVCCHPSALSPKHLVVQIHCRQRKGHFVGEDGWIQDIYTDYGHCRRRIRLFFGDDVSSERKCFRAISITLFRVSNVYYSADVVNNQLFNKSRLLQMSQATFVKSLIDRKISFLQDRPWHQVPGGRRLAPQGAWEMLRSPAALRGLWQDQMHLMLKIG